MASSATTEKDLANMALIMLGQQPITSLDASNNRAVLADNRLADVRDSVLRAHPWNSAVRRASLSADSSVNPTWGYDKRYALPSDFVRLLETEDPLTEYKIEGGNTGESTSGKFIVTDATEMKIRYIFRLTDVSKMDDTLKHAIATRLAAEIGQAVTGDINVANMMLQKYEAILMQASFEDSQGHHSIETIHGGHWLDSRLGGGVYRDFPALDSSGVPQ